MKYMYQNYQRCHNSCRQTSLCMLLLLPRLCCWPSSKLLLLTKSQGLLPSMLPCGSHYCCNLKRYCQRDRLFITSPPHGAMNWQMTKGSFCSLLKNVSMTRCTHENRENRAYFARQRGTVSRSSRLRRKRSLPQSNNRSQCIERTTGACSIP